MSVSQWEEKMDSIKGTIERVTFQSEESGFCVLRVKVAGHRELLTVVGTASNVQAGEFIECQGVWLNDKKHGLQYKADVIKTAPPSTVEGMEKYLASGMIKGIGPGYAKRLIRAFKDKVFEVIENFPSRLSEVEGIGKVRQQKIIKGWQEQKKIREIMLFLHSHGVGTARAVRIYKTYGDLALARIKVNPYCLANDIHGIGFKTADSLAQKMGVLLDSILRVRAGVTFCLQENTNNGHCGVEKGKLIEQAVETLGVKPDLIEQAIHDEQIAERIIEREQAGQTICFLASLFFAETSIAKQIERLTQGDPPWGSLEIGKAIAWVQEKNQITFSQSQAQAVKMVLQNKVAIVTGGPGVGKTTIVNSIIKIIAAKNVKILLAAPTGRAAKRLTESTGILAKTIHRLLEFDPTQHQFKRHIDSPLETDVLVIDECSMVDVVLMNKLLQAVPTHAAVLLVGDVDQLPSVGPGMVLKDLIDSQQIPTIALTEIFRQAASSQIITNAHRINKGELPLAHKGEALTDFYVIHCEEVENIKDKLLDLVCKRIPATFKVDPIQDIQVLTPTKRGSLGTVSLNIELQKRLNPQPHVIEKYGNVFGVKDKVIQIVNNYDKDVFNGDIGVIYDIDFEENILLVDFEGKQVSYEFSELDELNLAYASTIHKSQGSEYPVVVMPLTTQHYTLLERNLLYTGVTRGKKLVVLIGQKRAIVMATKRVQAQKRVTSLRELMVAPV